MERDFPGQRIGPEPTTDRFVAVMNGKAEGDARERCCHGLFKAVQSLEQVWKRLLKQVRSESMPVPNTQRYLLCRYSRGPLGEKQRIGRSYDFAALIEWFATRADRILLLFDAHKLDISDEFRRSIEMLKGHDDKIRVVLNKSDRVSNQQLMRVYGAMMWSLGKVVRSPEVLRVYISSFWDKPYADVGASNADLFDKERNDLLADLRSLPRNSAVRKINELIKRSRLCKVHALLVSHLKSKMPSLWGHGKAQKKILDNIVEEFRVVQRKYALSPGDFPNVNRFKQIITQGAYELNKFPVLKPKLIEAMDHVLSVDVPALLKQMPILDTMETQAKVNASEIQSIWRRNGPAPGSGFAIGEAKKAEYMNIFYTSKVQAEKRLE